MTDYKEYKITPDNSPVIRFKGIQMGFVSSERPNAKFWTELTAYRTVSGKTIVVTAGVALDKSSPPRISVDVFDNEVQMISKIGTGVLAARLYDQMGIKEIVIE